LYWYGYGAYIYVFGQQQQTYGYISSSLTAGSQYTLRLVHSYSSRTTTGYLYAEGSSTPIATSPALAESFPGSLKVGVVANDQSGVTTFSAVGVNGTYVS